MKITPLAGGSGSPGTVIGNVEVGSSASRDKKVNALRAFKGEAPVSLNQSDTPTDPVETQRVQKKRTLTMRTNATPGYVPPEQEAAIEPGSVEQQTAISDNSEQTPAPEETKPLSPQFAALARQKRTLQQERAAFEKEKADFKAQQQPQGIDLSKLKSDPLGVLQQAGVTYDELTQAIMNGDPAPNAEVIALQKRIEELEKGVDNKLSERDDQAKQQVLREIKRDAERMAFSSEEFKAIRATKSFDDVVELIDRTWTKSGELLDVPEAMKLVEKQLREEISPIAKELGFQSADAPAQQQQPQQRQMKTLTNRDGSVALLTPKQRAIMAFEGKLRKA
jgi:hypothetical protein